MEKLASYKSMIDDGTVGAPEDDMGDIWPLDKMEIICLVGASNLSLSQSLAGLDTRRSTF